ncbi:ABC transporter permease [Frondihabitans sucicola]|uniref:ABC transporter permease n=1 Tax=Frondihabitans sucicola TaxID=1268041 RepID=UPI0025741E0B|nr:ABC transporter permease [Frondihabitans sucicola]
MRASGSQRKSAFRLWYGRLHPSLQLIGLQLWLPLFFIVMFCLCYVAAFHAPHPHEVPVALVGVPDSVRQAIDKALPGVLHLENYSSLSAAKSAVLHGHMAIAYDGSSHEIFKATAHQYQVAALIPAMLTPILAAAGVTATVTDLAPLPAWDEYGTVSLYLMLSWCIGGYMVAMFIGLMGAPLRHRTRVLVILGGGVVIAFVTNVLAGPVIGAVHGHFGMLFLIAWGWIVAIGLAVNGFSYFAGRFIALPAMVVFIFLSMPSSGAAYPAWFMREPFAWLNNVVVGSGITEMLKRELYGVGPGFGRGVTMMAGYAVAGIILMLVGKQVWERRRIRAITTGRTTMFQDAQAANRDFLISERDAVLARHRLSQTETGTISTIPEEERDDDFEDPSTSDMFLGSLNGLEATAPRTRPTRVVSPEHDEGPRAAAYPEVVTRLALHRLFLVLVVVFIVGAVVLYVLSIALAERGGDTARHFDQYAIYTFMGAVLFGIIDFFVRPVMRATSDGSRDVEHPLNG